MLKRLVLSLLALPMVALWGDVKLPALFTDHGVLARSAKTPIFGKADPGEAVTPADQSGEGIAMNMKKMVFLGLVFVLLCAVGAAALAEETPFFPRVPAKVM